MISMAAAMRNGSMQKTRRSMLDHLKRHPGATVDELAAASGIAPITARGHLAVLKDQELIRSREVRGRRGRPFRQYFLTEAAEAYFPKQYEQLAAGLLSGLSELEGNDGLRVLIAHVANQTAAQHLPRMAGRPFPDRVKLVASLLDEQGGATELERSDEGFVVREHNCPYLSVSLQSDHVCELDRQVISHLVGAPVRVSQRLRDGAESCAFHIGAASSDT
jgi:predicted ArsR family transcriptional regulator